MRVCVCPDSGQAIVGAAEHLCARHLTHAARERTDETEYLRMAGMTFDDWENIEPFRTISLMVNSSCNLACQHCDLPRQYDRYEGTLGADQWEVLLERVIAQAAPEVIGISAMEPLLPDGTQEKSVRILRVAYDHGIRSGLVTNGMFAEGFFQSEELPPAIDFLDISFDGPPAVNDQIRGPKHRVCVESFLASKLAGRVAKRLYISTTLNSWNLTPAAIREHVAWVRRWVESPRIVLLLLHPNEHVDSRLSIASSRFEAVLDCLHSESAGCEEVFLEVFPSSLPDLAGLVERGLLPGSDSVIQDDTGMPWGHIGENLFVRYNNDLLLRRYNLRLSPEGHALCPESLETAGYLQESPGNLVSESLAEVWRRIESSVANNLDNLPRQCLGRDCLPLCAGENRRCQILQNGARDETT